MCSLKQCVCRMLLFGHSWYCKARIFHLDTTDWLAESSD